MNKKLKKILLLFVGIILVFGLYVTFESIRMGNNYGSKPLIILSTEERVIVEGDSKIIIYNSLGFKIKDYYFIDPKSNRNNNMYQLFGQDMELFGIRLWSWIS